MLILHNIIRFIIRRVEREFHTNNVRVIFYTSDTLYMRVSVVYGGTTINTEVGVSSKDSMDYVVEMLIRQLQELKEMYKNEEKSNGRKQG